MSQQSFLQFSYHIYLTKLATVSNEVQLLRTTIETSVPNKDYVDKSIAAIKSDMRLRSCFGRSTGMIPKGSTPWVS
jgi:hypothetical protein